MHSLTEPRFHQSNATDRRTRSWRAGVAVAALLLAPLTAAHPRLQGPERLSDSEFWDFFSTNSEVGGTFVSENFVSNELEFQEVIPSLQRSLTPSGVYLGVGPEQNFTYIANLKPRLAVIFDIRRQNAMQHLMYKALFELSPTRAEFVARLFSRPRVARLGEDVPVGALFDSANAEAPSDSAFLANHDAILQLLTQTHGFTLSRDDIATIENVYSVFHEAGPAVSYATRSSSPGFVGGGYPTYASLQSATNADSVPMAFLATEENYRVVRDLQLRNLIIPVVGDFGGRKAIRAVGEYLRKRRLTVTAFYVSNVEQYLFREIGAADEFYGNVASLPIDTTSTFIRSVPRQGGPVASLYGPSPMIFGRSSGAVPPAVGSGGFSIAIRDSAGVRTTRTVRDSAGVQLIKVVVDSSSRRLSSADSTTKPGARQDSAYVASLRALLAARDSAARQWIPLNNPGAVRMVMMGGLLRSGVASMRETLDAFFAKRLQTYEDVIRMTKLIN